MFLHLVNGV